MINVDSVYRKLQDISNKDQRSSIKPSLFNNFAEMAVYAIIEQSRKIIENSKVSLINGKSELKRVDYARDLLDHLYSTDTLSKSGNVYPKPSDIDSLDDLFYNNFRIEKASSIKHVNLLQRMGRHLNPDEEGANLNMVHLKTDSGYSVFPSSLEEDITAYYWRKPLVAKWTYLVVDNTPIFNAGASDRQDFDLPERFLDEVVIRIALLAGINIRDRGLLEPILYINKEEIEENKPQWQKT